MDELRLLAAYASALEIASLTGNWQLVGDCLADDAVYDVASRPPFGGSWRGRDAIVHHLEESVNTFARDYDERQFEVLAGPEMRRGAAYMRSMVTYRRRGAPDMRVESEEEAWIRSGKIARLKETKAPST